MTSFAAPDLANGHILHGADSANAWVTEIQAVLVQGDGGGDKTLYLAHECRKERLPFCNGPLGGGSDIFMRDKPYEFLTYAAGGRFWELVNADTIFPPQGFDGLDIAVIGDSRFILPVTQDGWTARVQCPWMPASVVGWDEVRQGLAGGGLPLPRLFCRFNWEEDGTAWHLHCPARYVNFATTPDAGAYLQPISGYVMVPFRGSFQLGYFACAITRDGRAIAEFLVPRYVDAVTRLAQGYGLDAGAAPIPQLRQMMPAYVRVFDWVRKCPGRLEFYVYDR